MRSIFLHPIVRNLARQAAGRFHGSPIFRLLLRLLTRSSRAAPSRQVTIGDLDEVANRAPSLERFLADGALTEEYFRRLTDYFGASRFPRKSYLALLRQVKRVAREVPGFGDRLWRDDFTQVSFEIKTVAQTTGRHVALDLWKLHRFQWLSSLRSTAGLRDGSEGELMRLKERASNYLRDLHAKTAAFELELARVRRPASHGDRADLSRKDRRLLRAQFYRGLQDHPELKRAAALVLHAYLTSRKNQRFFQLSDADLIICFVKELKQSPREVAGVFPELRAPSLLLTAIKSLIPSAQTLLDDQRMFPPNTCPGAAKTSTANYVTRFIRPLHAIWLGIPENDCLAGDPAFLDSLTPERWAVSALQSALTAVIERNGRYQGFARFVPMRSAEGELFASFETWAPVMVNRVVLPAHPEAPAEAGAFAEKDSQLFFDAWYPKLMAVLPRTWKGLVVSESALIDNAGVKRALSGSAFWSAGRDVGAAEGFHHIDASVAQLKDIVKPSSPAMRYCADMVFDARIPDAGRLHALAAPREQTPLR